MFVRGKEFPPARWRDAIQVYLDAVWAGKFFDDEQPSLEFGVLHDIGLRLNPQSQRYVLEVSPQFTYDTSGGLGPNFRGRHIRCRTLRRDSVENALIRFLRDPKIRAVSFHSHATMHRRGLPFYDKDLLIWKRPRRSELGMQASAGLSSGF